MYGLTEVFGPITICEPQEQWHELSPRERAQQMSRQGVAMIQAESARVVDDSLEDVPADGTTVGEVVLRGNNVMIGYYKDVPATRKAFEGGWFHTGDLAVRDASGYIKIKDRSKDVIISGGENISSVEVEDAQYHHPAVMSAAVVAEPDEKWGEVPCAFVEVKPDHDVSQEDLIAFCREHLARFKVPKRIVFGTLPKTSTGKIQKYMLRQQMKSASAVSGRTAHQRSPAVNGCDQIAKRR